MATPLSPKLEWSKANPIWAQSLNPFLANPFNSMSIISNYSFKAGTNILNHGLGHMMKGWVIIDPQGSGNLYRSAPLNSLTLTLTSNADFICSIGVF